MSLNESIVEHAALEGFGELGYAVGHGPHVAPCEPAAERDSFGDVVQSRCVRSLTGHLPPGDEKCAAILRLTSPIPSHIPATLRDTLLPKLLSGEVQITQQTD